MTKIDMVDSELYKTIYIEKDYAKFTKLWGEIREDVVLLKEAIKPCKDKFNQYDTVLGTTICEQILYDYKNVDSEIYQELINLIYSNVDIARKVVNGASNGGYSYLLISLFNLNLKLTDAQKHFAVSEAMNKVGTSYWKKIQERFSKRLDEKGINDETTVYMDFGGSVNPIGQKTSAEYMNLLLTSMGREQAHGTGEFDIRYHILRNPNWTYEEKRVLIMEFWTSANEYDDCLEQWEWGVVNDNANFKYSSISPMDPYLLYQYTYAGLLKFYGDKETADRIWDEIQFCKQMHELRPHQNEARLEILERVLSKN